MSLRANFENWLDQTVKPLEWVTLATIVSAIVASIVVFAGASNDRKIAVEELDRAASVAYTKGELARVRGDLVQIEKRLDGFSKPSGISVDINRVRQIENRLNTLEKGLIESPERALSLPLMRRDLQAFETNSKQEIGAIRQDIDRLYTLIMWLIGIIITVSLGVLGVLITRPRTVRDS